MEKIDWYTIERYAWECSCGQFNEEDEDPTYMETFVCEECGKEFKIGDME